MNRSKDERKNVLSTLIPETSDIQVEYLSSKDFYSITSSNINAIFDFIHLVNHKYGNLLFKSIYKQYSQNIYTASLSVRSGNCWEPSKLIEQSEIINSFIPKLSILYNTPISYIAPYDRSNSRIYLVGQETGTPDLKIQNIKKILLDDVFLRFDSAHKKKDLIRPLKRIHIEVLYILK